MMLDVHLVAGTGAGIFTSLLLHPLDVLKVRFQVQDGLLHANRYTTISGAIKDIWTTEGARGFYRGVAPGAWGSGISWGLYFYFYEACKRRMVADAPSGSPLSTGQHMYAAWEAGSITSLFTNPVWLVKTRMQTAPAPVGGSGVAGVGAARKGMWRTLVDIGRQEGIRGLYRGLVPALLLTSHGSVQFGVYEYLKGTVGVPQEQGLAAAYLLAYGAISKAAAVTATYPYQVIKSRVQQSMEIAPGGVRPYDGLVDTARAMARNEGAKAFYKGFAANLLRVAPQSALTLTAYEWIREAVEGKKPKPVGH